MRCKAFVKFGLHEGDIDLYVVNLVTWFSTPPRTATYRESVVKPTQHFRSRFMTPSPRTVAGRESVRASHSWTRASRAAQPATASHSWTFADPRTTVPAEPTRRAA